MDAAHANPSVQRNLILGLLLALAAGAWAVLVWQSADADMDMAMASSTMGMRAPLFLAIWVSRIGGTVLVAAGLYQLTPLKGLCLSKCRTPINFIMTSWRDGAAGALRMGLLHGPYCAGCCWLLFVILFPLGT